jgi:hypothetical protein
MMQAWARVNVAASGLWGGLGLAGSLISTVLGRYNALLTRFPLRRAT